MSAMTPARASDIAERLVPSALSDTSEPQTAWLVVTSLRFAVAQHLNDPLGCPLPAPLIAWLDGERRPAPAPLKVAA